MKNKKLTYLLVPLVILIWGALFIKIYLNFHQKNVALQSIGPEIPVLKTSQTDSVFTLVLDYPDPFLKEVESISYQSDPFSLKGANSKSGINWPGIEYMGFLSKNKSECTGLLRFGDSNLLVKQGHIYSGLKVLAITRDSINVEFKKETKWLTRLK